MTATASPDQPRSSRPPDAYPVRRASSGDDACRPGPPDQASGSAGAGPSCCARAVALGGRRAGTGAAPTHAQPYHDTRRALLRYTREPAVITKGQAMDPNPTAVTSAHRSAGSPLLIMPARTSIESIAESMEILDPAPELEAWRGAHPGWGLRTIYALPKRDA